MKEVKNAHSLKDANTDRQFKLRTAFVPVTRRLFGFLRQGDEFERKEMLNVSDLASMGS